MFELKLETLLYSKVSRVCFPFKVKKIKKFYGTITMLDEMIYRGKIELESYNNCLFKINLKDMLIVDFSLLKILNMSNTCQIQYNNRYIECYFLKDKAVFHSETNAWIENFSFVLTNPFKEKIKI